MHPLSTISAPAPQPKPKKRAARRPNRGPTPTHFLAIPLNTNPALRARVAAFQDGLFEPAFQPDGTRKPPVRGLDRSVVIDPIRFHLTLGVMALAEEPAKEVEEDEAGMAEGSASMTSMDASSSSNPPPHPSTSASNAAQLQPQSAPPALPVSPSAIPISPCHLPEPDKSALTSPPLSPSPSPPLIPTSPSLFPPHHQRRQNQPRQQPPLPRSQHHQEQQQQPLPSHAQPLRTVASALALLRSLKPQIDAILAGEEALQVVLEAMDIMRPVNPWVPKPKRKPKSAKGEETGMGEENGEGGGAVDTDVGAEELQVPPDVSLSLSAVDVDLALPVSPAEPSTSASTNDDTPTPTPTPAPDLEQDPDPNPTEVWADVMYLAPRETGEDGVKLRKIADLVNTAFRREGYILENRPLRLHCTILNTSKRRPAWARGRPFCYSDVLRSDALRILGASPPPVPPPLPRGDPGRAVLPEPSAEVVEVFSTIATTTAATTSLATETIVTASETTTLTTTTTNTLPPAARPQPQPQPRPPPRFRIPRPPPVPVDLTADEAVRVREVGLWVMGSRGPRGEYVSCGGVAVGVGE
ncbi:hypothetical protein LshimejAT787_2100100 [Lyophyllum shimeji]|uniref:A-kinase anchor protein 7-like phosphoesterase domain-containing protein n=1 Tax=Lyophyllum shimeji TaxID=47721 RepID=A0A9P3UUY4_LYOSH|nr:hypothetical protein LshimejAT787_2100100 [Lyophyllum shimeji]